MSLPGSSRPASDPARSLEVLIFRVGGLRLAAPRDQVKGIRPSPRSQSRGGGKGDLATVSLSMILGLSRDTAVDQRVIEVEHWGQPLGLEVTGIEGILRVAPGELHVLPDLVLRNLGSRNILGLIEAGVIDARGLERIDASHQEDAGASRKRTALRDAGRAAPALALDLLALLVEQGVELEPAG